MLTANQIKKIFETWQAAEPHPTTELKFDNHFELLIAVMLSAQATDVSVNKATVHLFKVANTPEKIVDLSEEKLKKYIKTIGLYHTKAKNVIATCKLLIEKHNSTVPNDRVALEALPGVGRKTANVVLNTAFSAETIAVDTHIFRVSNRMGLANGKTPLAVETQLLKNIPKKFRRDAHHWLILHGRYTCIARSPKCGECTVRNFCEFPEKSFN